MSSKVSNRRGNGWAGGVQSKEALLRAVVDGKLSVEEYKAMTDGGGGKSMDELRKKVHSMEEELKALRRRLEVGEAQSDGNKGSTPDVGKWLAGIQSLRVKEAAEAYSRTKGALVYPKKTKQGYGHPLAGQPVKEMGRVIEEPSQLDRAVIGAYCKFVVNSVRKGGSRLLGYMSLTDHEKELLHYAMENMEWRGSTTGGHDADIVDRRLTPSERKALIDDSTSGGMEAVPVVFDDAVIQAPLLNGELFPLVNVVPIDRGRRVEGVSIGKVTGSWGGVDDSPISLFDTASYVSAFDTTIYRWEGAITVGLDFLSDTPVDFGTLITNQYGERLLEDLDDVIATGNGTTQPEGVINKSGTATVNFGGATTIGAYESLRFSVSKQEHVPPYNQTAVFCGTETSYMRALSIPVSSTDARRLYNANALPDYDGYVFMGRPYKINSSLGNQRIFYAVLGRYRMYRRRGLTLRTTTEGATLVRGNEMLIVATARYGGQLERGACAAITTNAPA